jgi:D-glycero-alpha-D-manno-heptose-7-phosphate kinase
LKPNSDHNFRITYSKVETVKTIEQIEHPVVREVLKLYKSEVGLEIHHDGDLPARSGIGSSSAFAVGMIHAVKALREDLDLDKETLASEAITLEQKILRENVGSQDQISCAMGGLNYIEFRTRGKGWEVSPLQMSIERQLDFESRMVLIYSGMSRISSDISSGLLKNINSNTSRLRKVQRIAQEGRELLLGSRDLDQVGQLLDESWKIKREVNPLASNSELDEIYRKAKSCGALGGKILGAGGGGFFLFWLPRGKKFEFLAEFNFGKFVPIKIDKEGTQLILK